MKTKTRKRDNLSKNSRDNLREGAGIWASFYRANPHRLVKDYLQLGLFPFQAMLLNMMNNHNLFVFIACRGLGKSYLTALYCVVRCILYPGTTVCIASGSKQQAGMIITEKIEAMRRQSPALNAEIEDIDKTKDIE